MTTQLIQPPVGSPPDLADGDFMSRRLSEITTLLAGLEAEIRRAHALIATERLERTTAFQNFTPPAADAGHLAARVSALEQRPTAPVSQDATTVAEVGSQLATLAAAGAARDGELARTGVRLDELERVVGLIGQQFAELARKGVAP